VCWAAGSGSGAERRVSTERPSLPRGPYLVVGLGGAGRAAVDALLAAPVAERVLAWDGATAGGVRVAARRLRRRGVEVLLGGDGLVALDAAGSEVTVVKSPGIDLDIPLLERARSRGAEVFDELELGWRLSERPIVGVTGTNGKSTTAKLIGAVLEASGQRAHMAGNTEFGPPLSAAPADGWTVCEVSSFQLEASPSFLPDIAVFTNLTPEHLTRHLTMEHYGAAKRLMFVRGERTAGTAIVNHDDPWGRRLALDIAATGGRVLSYGFHADADIGIERADWSVREARLSLRTPAGAVECSTRLPGAHNASNVAAALAVGYSLGLPAAKIARALAGVDAPPGRWEVITVSEPFDVIVDSAHTPDGIRQLLQTARAVVSTRDGAALRTVFGAVGLRDTEKARESVHLARELSDHLILTTGSAPRDPRILRLEELRRAAMSGGVMETVLERRSAIERAIAAAAPGDLVAVLGLGALQRMVVDAAGTICPHDDRQVVRETLARARMPAWS
jgi:UDP-N-acetylmuramoylalanine-D-glutamate ligase